VHFEGFEVSGHDAPKGSRIETPGH
jgi:hypothetical protein